LSTTLTFKKHVFFYFEKTITSLTFKKHAFLF
jgi:hypothetical protein